MKKLSLFALSGVLLLSACQTPPKTPHPPQTLPAGSAYVQHQPLLHTRWMVSHLGQDPIHVEQPENQPFIQLSVDQHSNRLIGMGGCNRLMGSYVLNGQQLSFAVASTKRYCAEFNRIETALLTGLANTTHYQIDQRTLTLSDRQGTTLLQLNAVD